MRYRTTKCPYCAYKLEDRVTHAKELIGPPFAKCPSCHKPIKTGMKYWSDMSKFEKAYYILRDLLLLPFSLLVYTLASCIVPALVISIFVDEDELFERYPNLVIGYVVVVLILWLVLYIRNLVIQIRKRPQTNEIPEWE